MIKTVDNYRAGRAVQVLEKHLYRGLCPDGVEGFQTRDPSCLACHFLNRALAGMGFINLDEVGEWRPDWDSLEPRAATELLELAYLQAVDDEGLELYFSALESFAWSTHAARAIGRVEGVKGLLEGLILEGVVLLPELLREKADLLSYLYFFTGESSSDHAVVSS